MAVAGFVTPDSGRILLEGRDITSVPPERRGFGVVFQGYALFPHMTAAQNVAYPLRARGESQAVTNEKVRRVLDLVRLSKLADRKPADLSGGQQQRVAIARALVFEPPLLLLDEPMSALDRKLRGELQAELKELHGRLSTTFVNVTHDQEEALSLSSHLVVLSNGRVVQQGAPLDIYDRPETAFVAEFVGGANLLCLEEINLSEKLATGRFGGHRIPFIPRHPLRQGENAIVAVRQESLSLTELGVDGRLRLACRVTSLQNVGSSIRGSVSVEHVSALRFAMPRSQAPSLREGDQTTLSWAVEDGVHVRC